MTDKEFFLYTIKDELPRFERVFKAVEKIPQKKHSFRHDKKSRSTIELMTQTLGQEIAMMDLFLKTGKLDFMKWKESKFKTVADIRRKFVKDMNTVSKTAKKMPQKSWSAHAGMYFGDKLDWESTRGLMAWSFLLDAIHHRGQLSTHIRPMGGKVPSIYGPSADSSN